MRWVRVGTVAFFCCLAEPPLRRWSIAGEITPWLCRMEIRSTETEEYTEGWGNLLFMGALCVGFLVGPKQKRN